MVQDTIIHGLPGDRVDPELTIPVLVAKTGIPPDVLRRQRYSDIYLLNAYYDAVAQKKASGGNGNGTVLKNPDFN